MISGPQDLKATNLAHKTVTIRVTGTVIHVNWGGESLATGASVQLPASGLYTVWVGGRETGCAVRTPATLTFRGSDHPEFEVVTLYVEDARGSDTCRVESVIKR